jgi:CubicO group peptidase (beta-lactamase class C family)
MLCFACYTLSIFSQLIGSRIHQKKIGLDSRIEYPSWLTSGGDKRASLTVRELLRMTDGLDFDEDYNPPGDPPLMLFTQPSMAQFVGNRPLRDSLAGKKGYGFEHNRCFHYSSGTTNMLSDFLRRSFKRPFSSDNAGSTDLAHAEYLDFPFSKLFSPLHMDSMVLETDSVGTFVGSSFSYATARDWARLGLLFANDGIAPPTASQVGPRRVLPEGWVDFSRTPTPTSRGVYGAHFWLGGPDNIDTATAEEISRCDTLYNSRLKPKDWLRLLPSGSFLMHGFEEQTVLIVPSKRAVLVRLGATQESILPKFSTWPLRVGAFYRSILDLVPDSEYPLNFTSMSDSEAYEALLA